MSSEIEQAIEDFGAASFDEGRASRAGARAWSAQTLVALDARARLLALLAPEPEPSDAEIEAASKALYRRAFPWDEHNETSDEFRAIAKSVLAAARAARQTGGAGND